MPSKTLSYSLIPILLVSLLTAGCTKKKAEAIKIAAEEFQIRANDALDSVRTLLKQGAAFTQDDIVKQVDKLVVDLNNADTVDATTLSFLIKENSTGQEANAVINKAFDDIANQVNTFSAMYHSLPAGNILAKDIVKESEKHAINVTLNFRTLAKNLNDYPVQFTLRRVRIVEEIKEDKTIKDDALRLKNLKMRAQEIIEMRQAEENAKKQAIEKCLAAVESGMLVSKLIRDYNSLSVDDILILTRESLGTINDISGNRKDLAALLNKYDSIDSTIRNDPYWKALIDMPVSPQK